MTATSSSDHAPPRVLSLTIAETTVMLRGDRAMYWPERRWLVVADLHLGKAESLRRDGIALPDAVMTADLDRLRLAVAETGATRVLVLGDLVHDAAGLTPTLVGRVAAWRATLDCEIALIPGNHDRRVAELPPAWHIERLPCELEAAPFRFAHEPDVAPTVGHAFYSWYGHIHPVRTVRGGGDRARVPIFALQERAALLPAFSTLTGGGECPPEIWGRQWGIVDGRLVNLTRDSARNR